MNRAASQLGKLAKGKPKTLTKAERARRAKSLAVARAKRWPSKSNDGVTGPKPSAGSGTVDSLVGGSES